jgi:beta-glucanase (GH16 family)
MRKVFILTIILYVLFQSCKIHRYTLCDNYMYIRKGVRGHKKRQLIWEDNFNGTTLDTTKWTKVPAGNSAWDKHMSTDERCYALINGMLYLKGINNPDTSIDKRPFLTGGIYSKGKFAFQYGKIEIRARLGCALGAWPAMWMLAATDKDGAYPRNGEIDIMEHLNFDSSVYQTIHSYYTLVLKQDKNPPHYSTAKIHIDDFNVFGIEWYPGKIVYTVNGEETFTYPRVNNIDPSQWPFDQPFYILIDQQLGGSWVGNIKAGDLPVEMAVDWVKVYQ